MIFASSLFLGFFMRFRQQCPSQFQNLPIITSELSEAKITLVKNLFDALVTSRSKSAVCKAFYDYLESVSNITGRIGSPVAALEDEHGYLRQVLDDFCPGGLSKQHFLSLCTLHLLVYVCGSHGYICIILCMCVCDVRRK